MRWLVATRQGRWGSSFASPSPFEVVSAPASRIAALALRLFSLARRVGLARSAEGDEFTATRATAFLGLSGLRGSKGLDTSRSASSVTQTLRVVSRSSEVRFAVGGGLRRKHFFFLVFWYAANSS